MIGENLELLEEVTSNSDNIVSDKETPSSSIGVGYGMAERRFHRV
ncbi:hypothetical protein FB001_1841 [Ensifer sp. SEMIA 135]|nr:hypothetical protein FB000_1771 [Ensifer sp. SEMIA 134]TWB21022.1 hypothetical protein FB001_1841 [Ensifer sp. SEMIA 135]